MVPRRIVIGANSAVWRRLATAFPSELEGVISIGHAVVAGYSFLADDEVWVFAYAKDEAGNVALMDSLLQRGVRRMIYVSTVSTRTCEVTKCYRYPRVKLAAQAEARRRLGATILLLGLVYADEHELPGGVSMVTRLADIARLMSVGVPDSDRGRDILMAAPIERPFKSRIEQCAYSAYGLLLRSCGPYPCMLRPLDLLLRQIGWRWYGYFRIGNHLWTLNTSS